ncbi:hypothetical protein, partial [Massilia sp. DWR3-1-1]|uniref:hypothetical protein n=1 Tax=Massilia sp. DWR3-1-1 TaxID=2804559 RepID=UPI003CEB2D79
LLELVATLFAVFVRHGPTWKEMMPDCTLLWRQVELFNNASSDGYRFSAWQHLTAKGVALGFRGCPAFIQAEQLQTFKVFFNFLHHVSCRMYPTSVY